METHENSQQQQGPLKPGSKDEQEKQRRGPGRPPAKNPKNLKVSIMIDQATMQELDAACTRAFMDRSSYLRRALRESLMRDKGQ